MGIENIFSDMKKAICLEMNQGHTATKKHNTQLLNLKPRRKANGKRGLSTGQEAGTVSEDEEPQKWVRGVVGCRDSQKHHLEGNMARGIPSGISQVPNVRAF